MVCNFAIEARGQNIISVNCIKTKEIMMMRDLNKNFWWYFFSSRTWCHTIVLLPPSEFRQVSLTAHRYPCILLAGEGPGVVSCHRMTPLGLNNGHFDTQFSVLTTWQFRLQSPRESQLTTWQYSTGDKSVFHYCYSGDYITTLSYNVLLWKHHKSRSGYFVS